METEHQLKSKYLEYSGEKESRMTELNQLLYVKLLSVVFQFAVKKNFRGEEERLRNRLLTRPFTERLDPVPSRRQLMELKKFVDDLKAEHVRPFMSAGAFSFFSDCFLL